MFDILSMIYHEDPASLRVTSTLDDPETPEERRIATQLRAVDEKAAEVLKPSICALADKRAEQAFYSGVRFGAQLMAQLMGEF